MSNTDNTNFLLNGNLGPIAKFLKEIREEQQPNTLDPQSLPTTHETYEPSGTAVSSTGQPYTVHGHSDTVHNPSSSAVSGNKSTRFAKLYAEIDKDPGGPIPQPSWAPLKIVWKYSEPPGLVATWDPEKSVVIMSGTDTVRWLQTYHPQDPSKTKSSNPEDMGVFDLENEYYVYNTKTGKSTRGTDFFPIIRKALYWAGDIGCTENTGVSEGQQTQWTVDGLITKFPLEEMRKTTKSVLDILVDCGKTFDGKVIRRGWKDNKRGKSISEAQKTKKRKQSKDTDSSSRS